MVVRIENFNMIADELERQEVVNGGVLSNSEYAKLLAIYLFQNDITSAKLLWKRIPLTAKRASPELEAIWKVLKGIRRRDYPEIYATLNYSWSIEIMPMMQVVKEEIRKNTLKLIAKCYSSLEIKKLCKYTGCDVQGTLAIVEEKGWKCDDTFVFPESVVEEVQDNRSEYNAFEKLTDSISYLEN